MKKNLIYNVCPFKRIACQHEWKNNIAVLKQYMDIFDGRKIVTIVTGPRMVDPKIVARHFDGYGCEIVEMPNNPSRGENGPFMNALDILQYDDMNSITFYAHTKGVSHRHMGKPERMYNIRTWRNLMYYFNLHDINHVEDVLKTYKTFGIMRRTGGHPCYWHYSGTFFWFRNDTLFSHPNWRNIRDVYGGVEMYLGDLIDIDYAYCDLNIDDPRFNKRWYFWENTRWAELIKGSGVSIEEIDAMSDVSDTIPTNMGRGDNGYKHVEDSMGVSLSNPKYVNTFRKTINQMPEEIQSLVDLGAGVGALSVAAKERGYNPTIAYDLFSDRKAPSGIDYRFEDFTKLTEYPFADLYAAIEVFEHIDDESLNRFMANCNAPYFLFSSTPHHSKWDVDWGHINIKPTDEWVKMFSSWGYELHTRLTTPTKWTILFKKKI